MKRAFLLWATVLLLAALMVGCGGQGQNSSNPDLSRVISDEATGGTEGFLFLPPIAPAYPYDGVFDPNLALKVEIHQVDSNGNLLNPDVLAVTFNMAVAGAPADEGIRVDTASELYVVNWHTDRFDLQDRGFYRIFVLRASDNAEYGFADVEIFTSAKEAKSLVTGDTVALVDGRTLPIKLRIEQGANPRVPGGRIAFSSDRDGNYEIYVMNSDGSNQVNVTNNASNDMYSFWSPDGTKIAFGSNRDDDGDIYVMNADGSNQTRLTNNPGIDVYASWSPDGSKIVFISNRQGGWEWQIYVMNSDGSNQTKLTSLGRNLYPSWSPDGSKIVFFSTRDGYYQIYVMNSDGSNQVNVTNSPEWDFYPSWSPDGSKIAFTSYRDGNTEIYAMNSDGSNQTNLTNNPALEEFPCWSPDGSRIAFSSYRDGNWEIYVMNSDGSNQVNVTNNPAWDNMPFWSPF